MATLPKDKWAQNRLLTSSKTHEDAAIVRIPAGKAIVQTLDFFTPVVNDPYKFGQIAAANSLSDVYAMGGEPWCAMNIVCFPIKTLDNEVLSAILCGGADKIAEAGAALAGGHSVDDPTVKYGLSVTGLVDPDNFASNAGLEVGDVLIATKAIGTGVLATAVKAEWEGAEALEDILYQSASRLNKAAGAVIRDLRLKAATDITGFGLGGHLMEMLAASNLCASIHASSIALLPQALELVATGLLPVGSYANRAHKQKHFKVCGEVDTLLVDLIFDAQTSGGMILAVPANKVTEAVSMLKNEGEIVSVIGQVEARDASENLLRIYK